MYKLLYMDERGLPFFCLFGFAKNPITSKVKGSNRYYQTMSRPTRNNTVAEQDFELEFTSL